MLLIKEHVDDVSDFRNEWLVSSLQNSDMCKSNINTGVMQVQFAVACTNCWLLKTFSCSKCRHLFILTLKH